MPDWAGREGEKINGARSEGARQVCTSLVRMLL